MSPVMRTPVAAPIVADRATGPGISRAIAELSLNNRCTSSTSVSSNMIVPMSSLLQARRRNAAWVMPVAGGLPVPAELIFAGRVWIISVPFAIRCRLVLREFAMAADVSAAVVLPGHRAANGLRRPAARAPQRPGRVHHRG